MHSKLKASFFLITIICLYGYIYYNKLWSQSIVTQAKSTNIIGISDQDVIDKFIIVLSQQNYDKFNDDITLDNYLFQKFSYRSMYNALYNNSILFVGDSIVYYFYSFILSRLNDFDLYYNKNNTQPEIVEIMNNKNNTFHNRLSLKNGFHKKYWNIFNGSHRMLKFMKWSKTKQYTLTNIRNLTAHNTFWHHSFFDNEINLTYYQHWILQPSLYNKILFQHMNKRMEIKYNIIYINFAALHLLHLYPKRKYGTSGTGQLNMLINIEKYFDEIIEIALKLNNVKCIIFRSSQAICKDKYVGKFKELVQLYTNDSIDDNITNDCYKSNSINPTQIYLNYSYNYNNYSNFIINGYDLCSSKWTLTNNGSMNLNERMRKYITLKQNTLNRKLKLIFFDAFKLYVNRCQYTAITDGRHYHRLLPVQMMAFANIINNFC
eukprot:149357_1